MDEPQVAIMVTGAAGLLGQQTLRSLAIRGQSVVASYRSRIPEAIENVYPFCHDLREFQGLVPALKNIQTVVHLAWEGGLVGTTESQDKKPGDDKETSANIQMVKNLLKAMEEAGTQRIIFVSALGASQRSEAEFLREKYLAEHLVLNSKIQEKIILRSTIVWSGRGDRDPFLRTIIRLLKYPFYPLPSKGATLAPIHARDLGRIIADAALCSIHDAAGFVEVNGSEVLPLADICKIVGEKFVGKPRFPIRGVLGEALLPLIERETSRVAKGPRISNFLAVHGILSEAVATANPLKSLTEGKFASFREHVAEP